MAIQWVFNPFTGKLDATSVEDLSAYALTADVWLNSTAQTGLTGDKTGSFNLTTTGTGTFGTASIYGQGVNLAVGSGASAPYDGATAIGYGSSSYLYGTALGGGATVGEPYGIALGYGAIVSYQYSTAIGVGVNTTADYQLVLGGYNPTTTSSESWLTILPGTTANTPIVNIGGGSFTTSGTLGAGAITGTSLTDSGLTITRVPYASTAGLLVDSTNLTFDGTTLTAGGFTTTGTGTLALLDMTKTGADLQLQNITQNINSAANIRTVRVTTNTNYTGNANSQGAMFAQNIDTSTITGGAAHNTLGIQFSTKRTSAFSNSNIGGGTILSLQGNVENRGTYTYTGGDSSMNTQGYACTFVAAPTVNVGAGNTLTTANRVITATFLGTPIITSGALIQTVRGVHFSGTGNSTGGSSTYQAFYTSVTGYGTLWALYNDGAGCNNFMGKDSTYSYFGTGNDALITFTGTQLQIQSDNTTATDSFLLRGGTNGILFNIGASQYASLTATALTSSPPLVFSTATSGVTLKQGANGKCGTFVANGITPVTVGNTSVAITDTIVFSLNTVGGTVGAYPTIQTITAATGFTVACTALDSSTYNYIIISNAA